MIQQVVPQGQLGNRYKSFTISLPDGTIDWSLCENNSADFPDWNENWNERDYWDICIIKQLTKTIYVKFHGEQYNQIRIKPGDSPVIFEHIVYRDILISNSSGDIVEFDIILVNNRTITPPPLKPVNLTAIATSSNSINLQFEDETLHSDNFNEDYFKVEVSNIGPNSGFLQIGVVRQSATMYQKRPLIIKYSDTTVVGLTQYWYRIRSYSVDGGNSPYSNIATATTP